MEREYLKGKINDLETSSKNKNIRPYRDINEFKKGYRYKTNKVKDEKGNVLAELTVF